MPFLSFFGVLTIVLGSVARDMVIRPEEHLLGLQPRVHYMEDLPVEDGSKYYSGGRVSDEYKGSDFLKKSVEEAKRSGLESVKGAGGKGVSSGSEVLGLEYLKRTGAERLQKSGTAANEKVKEYGTSAEGGYGNYVKNVFKNGHSSNGFSKSYSNKEDGHDSSYVDEEHREGGERTGESYGDLYGEAGREEHRESTGGAGYRQAETGEGLLRSDVIKAGFRDHIYGRRGQDEAYNMEDSLRTGQQAGNRDNVYTTADQRIASYHPVN